jgi:hypothetical protein
MKNIMPGKYLRSGGTIPPPLPPRILGIEILGNVFGVYWNSSRHMLSTRGLEG